MIEKNFIINLRRRKDKLFNFSQTIQKKFKDEINVLEAIDGNLLDFNDENLIKRICKSNFNQITNKIKKPGVIGCCLSHLSIYDIIDNEEKYYLIFEDDAVLINDMEIESFLNTLKFPEDAGIIWLNYDHDYDDDDMQEIENIQLTTESYIIKGKTAKELLEFNLNNIGAIDAHIKQYFDSQNTFKMYSTRQLFKQSNVLKTDIQFNYPSISKKRNAFVISLKKRNNRLFKFYNKFQKFHDEKTSLYLKEAIDGDNLDENNSYNILFKNKKTKLKTGEIACLLSHYEVWKEMSKKNLPFAIIYEDDVEFHPNFKEISNKIYNEIPNDFQILYLGGRQTSIYPKYVDPISENISVHHPKIISGIDSDRTSHAYVISISCANILINLIESQEEFNTPLDHLILNYLLFLKIDVLNANPLIAFSDNTDGNIKR